MIFRNASSTGDMESFSRWQGSGDVKKVQATRHARGQRLRQHAHISRKEESGRWKSWKGESVKLCMT